MSKFFRGRCESCLEYLTRVDLNEEEFDELRKLFLDKVIVGKDILYGTTPEELKDFATFVHKNAPFDVVIDGLNTAYLHGNNKTLTFYTKLVSMQ